MKLTPDLLWKIRTIVEKHHAAFSLAAYTAEAIPTEVMAALEAAGLTEAFNDFLTLSYSVGLAQAQGMNFDSLSLVEATKRLEQGLIPLSPEEVAAINTAKANAGNYITGLAASATKQIGAMLRITDHEYREKVREGVSEAIANRETLSQLKSDLGHATKDWARDLHRVAITEHQMVRTEGVATGIASRSGPDAMVYFVVQPEACKHCIRLHIGPDGAPRLFRLSSLAPPGANVGRKAATWIANRGVVHPYCQCQLQHMPDGWGFDEDGNPHPEGELGLTSDGPLAKSMREDEERFERHQARLVQREFRFHGLPIVVETDAGSIRSWWDRKINEQGMTIMRWPYGYIKGTKAVDGDEVDVYVGPNENATHVYVVRQRKKQKDGTFSGYDEPKCMLGFSTPTEAKRAYFEHYDDKRFFGGMDAYTVEGFHEWLKSGGPSKRQGLHGEVRVAKSTSTAGAGPIGKLEGAAGSGAVSISVDAPPRNIQRPDAKRLRYFVTHLRDHPKDRILRPPSVYEHHQVFPWSMPIADAQGRTGGLIAEEQLRPDVTAYRANIERQAVMIRTTANPSNVAPDQPPPVDRAETTKQDTPWASLDPVSTKERDNDDEEDATDADA